MLCFFLQKLVTLRLFLAHLPPKSADKHSSLQRLLHCHFLGFLGSQATVLCSTSSASLMELWASKHFTLISQVSAVSNSSFPPTKMTSDPHFPFMLMMVVHSPWAHNLSCVAISVPHPFTQCLCIEPYPSHKPCLPHRSHSWSRCR